MNLRSFCGRIAAVACLAIALPARAARADTPKALSIDLGAGTTLDLVLVPHGSFREGSPETEKDRENDEHAHEVTLTRDVYMGKFLVTRKQYAAFVGATGYRTEAEVGASGGAGWDGKALVQKKEFTWKNPGFTQTEDDPVTLVTFDDAEAFARWVTSKAGRAVMLPSEAQWEYAARAGTSSAFYAGGQEDAALQIGWFKKNAGNGTRPVGQKAPNGYGLFDMGGNVFEWCRDGYAPYPESAVTDPVAEPGAAPGDKARRVLRGGSWLKDAKHMRSAARYKNAPGSRNADNGFRVVASADEAASVGVGGVTLPPQPPPVTRPEPPRAAPDGGSLAPLGLLLGAGVVAWLLYLLLRRRAAAPAIGSARPADVSVRVVADGFWISPGLPLGARVKYTCAVRGVPVTDTVGVDGGAGGTFVYTGGAPENARILEVTVEDDDAPRGGGFGGYRGAGPRPIVVAAPLRTGAGRTSDPPPAPMPVPFGGFPPAY